MACPTPPRLAMRRRAGLADALARLPLMLWCMVCAASAGHALLAARPAEGLVALAEAAARLAVFCFLCCMIVALALRVPAIARATGPRPTLVAFGGAFSVTGLALFPPAALPPAATVAALALMLGGYGLGCWAVTHLGRALSLTPEARHLVTSGPYRLVRHPLYAAEALASLGLLLQVLSPGAVLLWAIHIALQCRRMAWEEQVLRASFPAYAGYAAAVPRLLPRLPPRPGRRRLRSGAVAVEFALIATSFLGLLLFVLQLGYLLYAQIAVDYATVQAARRLQVDSSLTLGASRATFQALTFCPLLAPLLNCSNVLIGLHAVSPDYLTDVKTTPQATSGALTQPASFTPGGSGGLMLLQVTYVAPSFTWPIALGNVATYNGAKITAIVSSAPYANEY